MLHTPGYTKIDNLHSFNTPLLAAGIFILRMCPISGFLMSEMTLTQEAGLFFNEKQFGVGELSIEFEK